VVAAGVELFCCAEIDDRDVISGDLISGVCVMSANTLSRRACTAAFCAVFAIILNVPASSQSLSYMPVDRYRAILPEVLPQPGQQGESTYGGQELGALRPQVVSYASDEPPGTIVIDTAHTFLYLTLGNGKAIRYGIGVGRAGFTWSGRFACA
jgi:lipoprotein-anchoring transpeptidase ErfK/SrfK